MKIKINGKDVSVGAHKTLFELVSEKGLHPEKIILEHNLRIVPKEEWNKTALNNDDAVEIVSFVGGG